MANRRMFARGVVCSDAFIDMPISTQLLYYHLGMEADDDGFVSSPKRVSRMIGTNDDDLKILIAKRFILSFDSGIIVIKHWRLNNEIKKDRYHETQYLEEKKALTVKENGVYTECIQNVSKVDTEVRLGKTRLGKTRQGEGSAALAATHPQDKSPSEIARAFFESQERQEECVRGLILRGISETIARQEVRKFVSYWTEKTMDGGREKWELQSTFELAKRLAKWFDLTEKWWNKNKTNPQKQQKYDPAIHGV